MDSKLEKGKYQDLYMIVLIFLLPDPYFLPDPLDTSWLDYRVQVVCQRNSLIYPENLRVRGLNHLFQQVYRMSIFLHLFVASCKSKISTTKKCRFGPARLDGETV